MWTCPANNQMSTRETITYRFVRRLGGEPHGVRVRKSVSYSLASAEWFGYLIESLRNRPLGVTQNQEETNG